MPRQHSDLNLNAHTSDHLAAFTSKKVQFWSCTLELLNLAYSSAGWASKSGSCAWTSGGITAAQTRPCESVSLRNKRFTGFSRDVGQQCPVASKGATATLLSTPIDCLVRLMWLSIFLRPRYLPQFGKFCTKFSIH